jgi:hypothetical protein
MGSMQQSQSLQQDSPPLMEFAMEFEAVVASVALENSVQLAA